MYGNWKREEGVVEKFASEDSKRQAGASTRNEFANVSASVPISDSSRVERERGIMRRRCPRAKQSEILANVRRYFARLFVQIPGERHGYRSCGRVAEWDPLRGVERERGRGRGGGGGGWAQTFNSNRDFHVFLRPSFLHNPGTILSLYTRGCNVGFKIIFYLKIAFKDASLIEIKKKICRMQI